MNSIVDVWARLDAAVEAVGTVDWDGLPVTELLESVERLETGLASGDSPGAAAKARTV
jgi:hypothetical protein